MNLKFRRARRALRNEATINVGRMRFVRRCCVVLLSGFSCASTAVGEGFYLNTVSWGIGGDVYADFGHAKQINGGDIKSGTGRVSLDGAASEMVETPAPNHGIASAFAQFSGGAFQAELHAMIAGGVHGFNEPSSSLHPGFGSARIDFASVIARWQDTAVMSFPGPPGKTVNVGFTLVIDGPMSVTVSGDPGDNRNAQAQIRLNLRGDGLPPPPNNGYFGYAFENYNHTIVVNKPPPLIVFCGTTLKNGEAHTLDYSLELSAIASAGSSALTAGSADARFFGDFSQTVRWGGITSATDAATGQPITGWTITSASGFDYAHAAPEPSSVALVLISIAHLALLGRRRPQKRLSGRFPA